MSEPCTLVRVFTEFELLPDLLALAPGRALGRQPPRRDDTVEFAAPATARTLEAWTDLMSLTDPNMDHVVEADLPVGVAEELLLAQDAWRLGERLHLLWTEGRTRTGDRLAQIARRPWQERSMANHRAVVRTVATGIREQYVTPDGLEVVPLLQEAAQTLAETDHVWARHCPGLLLVEFEALIYWAFEDPAHAMRLRDELVTYRDVAMHRYRAPPPDDADPDDLQIVHEDATVRLYVETEELAARTGLTVTEVRSTAMLLVFAELMEESLLTAATYLTPPAPEDSRV